MSCLPRVPIIVADQAFTAQTSEFSYSYSVLDDGLYRISAYVEVSSMATATVSLHVLWTDDTSSNDSLNDSPNYRSLTLSPGPHDQGDCSTVVVRAKASTSLTVATPTGGVSLSLGQTYSAYVVIEKL